MNLKKKILTKNACYIAGVKIKPTGIMVHSTGANNSWLKRYVGPDDGNLGVNKYGNHWNRYYPDGRQVCVHAFIGKLKDGTIATYQTLPWNHRAWHCGGSGNNSYISFEICEDNLLDREYFNKVYREAVELCIFLCKMYGLNEKNIICHSEGYSKGIASNHSDVMHWFPKHGKDMNTFREDVRKELNNEAKLPIHNSNTSSFLFKVDISNLNIRTGPGVNYKTIGRYTGKGVFTIIEVKTGEGSLKGWGRLKSGLGWISLDYGKRV
ncbi:N-acetylmuramoyl-L-alanine amidase [Miniphocaeibacter massiliensis]|uniref:N-acetylmuramoyl-L-alanine amidase n=1 Tax=Miniphocaeibacter massiliensis TaxID=2041841 RepID=UPI000C1C4700|nr:N-acetylmuramoyl-L-alanine amidase [Miniphocaeibacter massiliensis]